MARVYPEAGEDGSSISDLEDDELETARVEAARALVDIAKELLSGAIWEDVTFEVRDDMGRAILRADISFSADQLASRLN